MKVKKFGAISVVVLLLLFSSYTLLDHNDTNKGEVLLTAVLRTLNAYHYQPQDVNDQYSQNVYKEYLNRLDFGKRYFTQADLDKLSIYEDKIDDQIFESSFEFFDSATTVYFERRKLISSFYHEILEDPFDFTLKEEIDLDPENNDYAEDEDALREVWRRLLKYQTMTRYSDMLSKKEEGEKYQDKTSEELEKEAREKVEKLYDNRFHFQDKYGFDDYRNDYVNVLTGVFDPHTSYFPPKDKEDFDINISGKLEGIGATLVDREGYVTVTTIVPGSPSAKQGELEVGDVILKVGQGDDEPVDVVDMRLDKAVSYIRGKKGTTVKLTIRKASGLEKTIAIVRDVVSLEERYAKSVILKEGDDNRKVGYIYLPSFYADFDDRASRNCTKDVEKEIEKLKAENVDGIVLDLRFNGGGSLKHVVSMAGLFIETGPIVQIKSRNGDPYVYPDKDPRVQYDGPLVVMVNSLSASASEILAAAIQDYNRGVVLGSESTYGKGTVQVLLNLDEYVQNRSGNKPLGAIKITNQKFYRINGDATQKNGVRSDISFLDEYSFSGLREMDEDYALSWDEISPVKYTQWVPGYDLEGIIAKSKARTSINPRFQMKEENVKRLEKQQEEQTYPLNLIAFENEKEQLRKEAEKFDQLNEPIDNFNISSIPEDLVHINSDSVLIKRRNGWIKQLEEDIYIYEAMQVIQDIETEAIVKKE